MPYIISNSLRTKPSSSSNSPSNVIYDRMNEGTSHGAGLNSNGNRVPVKAYNLPDESHANTHHSYTMSSSVAFSETSKCQDRDALMRANILRLLEAATNPKFDFSKSCDKNNALVTTNNSSKPVTSTLTSVDKIDELTKLSSPSLNVSKGNNATKAAGLFKSDPKWSLVSSIKSSTSKTTGLISNANVFSNESNDLKNTIQSDSVMKGASADLEPKKKKSRRTLKMTFAEKLMNVLQQEDTENAITWLPCGTSFVIVSPKNFTDEILPRFFKHVKFESFIRKLYRWGFRRVSESASDTAFYHSMFQRDRPELCKLMRSCSMSSSEIGSYEERDKASFCTSSKNPTAPVCEAPQQDVTDSANITSTPLDCFEKTAQECPQVNYVSQSNQKMFSEHNSLFPMLSHKLAFGEGSSFASHKYRNDVLNGNDALVDYFNEKMEQIYSHYQQTNSITLWNTTS